MEYVRATIDQIANFFVNLSGDTSWVILLVIFAAVFLVVAAVGILLAGRTPVERRLAGVGSAASLLESINENQHLRRREREGPWNKIVKHLESRFTPSDEGAKKKLRRRMIQGGIYSPNAVRNYYVIRGLSIILFPALYLFILPLTNAAVPPEFSLFFMMILAFFGMILPRAVLDRKVQMRQLAVQEAFPDSLDMMVVCVEAGLGLDAAFGRVGTQMAAAYPVISQHFAMVSLELRAGKSRAEALRAFSDRIGLPEINSFVTLMIQSDQLGTSIAQTLRVHSDEMRAKRVLRAEEKAHRLPVLLSIPLVVGILPAMMTVALLPAMIRIIRVLLPTLTGI